MSLFSFFCSKSLNASYNQLARILAQANREAIAVLAERETANARHFQQLCLESERAGR